MRIGQSMVPVFDQEMAGTRKVLERIPLDARRHLYLVEVGGKVLLLGAGDGAAPRLISEIDPDSLPELEEPRKASFADVMAKLRGSQEE